MKRNFLQLFMLLLAIAFIFNACKKESVDQKPLPEEKPTINYNQGLGNNPGYPVGLPYSLPSNIEIKGEIQGGMPGRLVQIDKTSYTGPFPGFEQSRNWVTYGTGTYVNLYVKFFSPFANATSFALPGGLIFCDTQDNDSVPLFQRGLLLQTVTINIPAMDTAFVHLPCYCLNKTFPIPNFDVVYYIGPITMNPQLNQLISIMSTKQYPIGEESTLQGIIWHITDDGLNLTSAEIQYLNSLP